MYRGEEEQTGKLLAIKRFEMTCEDEVEDIKFEIDEVSTLRQPNIVQCYGCCTKGTQGRIIRELMDYSLLDLVGCPFVKLQLMEMIVEARTNRRKVLCDYPQRSITGHEFLSQSSKGYCSERF